MTMQDEHVATVAAERLSSQTSPLDARSGIETGGADVPANLGPVPVEVPRKRVAKKAPAKRSAKAAAKGTIVADSSAGKVAAARSRTQRSFPAATFEDALELARQIQKMGSNKVRRLTLFDEMKKSPDSGASRQLITNSNRYGITKGSYAAEFLELTEDGQAVVSPETAPKEKARATFRLAIDGVPPFKAIYQEYAGKRLPSPSVVKDFLLEAGYADEEIQECIDTFTVNAKHAGVLKLLSGAEQLLKLDHALDELPGRVAPALVANGPVARPGPVSVGGEPDWGKVCFYVTPIGADDSAERKHSDLFLGSIVEPALADFDLSVVRADQIGKAGMITKQVIDYIAKSRIVIADMSFHNPNVFYEVALRHASRKPLVQIIRMADRIPFDLDQIRTVRIDTTDIYSLVPQLETYRSEIASQVRRLMEDGAEVDNPLTTFYPTFWDEISQH